MVVDGALNKIPIDTEKLLGSYLFNPIARKSEPNVERSIFEDIIAHFLINQDPLIRSLLFVLYCKI